MFEYYIFFVLVFNIQTYLPYMVVVGLHHIDCRERTTLVFL